MDSKVGGTPEPDEGSADPFEIEFDEEFVKGASTKEASARARTLAATWAKEPPKPTGWRSDTPDPLRSTPPPAAPARTIKPRQKRAWPRNAALALVAALIATVILYPRHHGQAPLNATPAGTAQPQPTAASVTPSPSPSPSPSASLAHPDDQYFTGSPALAWADNAQGIVVPTAHAVGHFGTREIAAGYQGLRQLLIAGNLDATILNGGPVTDFTRLLDTRSKLDTDLRSWIAHPTYKDNPTDLITRFNPAATLLLGHTVKVSGTMTAAVDKQGFLSVTADYRFVYAVGPATGSGIPSRAVVHRVYQLELATAGIFDAQSGRYWISDYAAEIGNTACFQFNGFINPEFGTNDGVPRSGKTVDPYASGEPLIASSPTPAPSGSPTQCDSEART